MYKNVFFLIVCIGFLACDKASNANPERFKTGTFYIPANENFGETKLVRNDSLQIETYEIEVNITKDSINTIEKRIQIDTLYIEWKDNFFYTLRMKTPKKSLDEQPIFVQINSVTDSSYAFTAKIGYSEFKQKGKVYKID